MHPRDTTGITSWHDWFNQYGNGLERIHAQLRADILGGRYAAGEPLPSERRLSEELDASRHAVREALKRLQQAGLVSISQGGATRVRDWRRHGGLELLLDVAAEGDAPEAPARAARGDGDARVHRRRRRAPLRPARVGASARPSSARAPSSSPPSTTSTARNAHYEVLWDLIVDGADNIAYRLALTTLVARQRVAPVARRGGRGRARATSPPIRALVAAVADGEPDAAHAVARDLLERSIPWTMAEVLYYAIPFFVLLLVAEYASFRHLDDHDEDDPVGYDGPRHRHVAGDGPRQRRRSTSAGSSWSSPSTPRSTS